MRKNFLLFLLGALVFTGCGSSNPATYPVQGKVVFPDGSPLPEGTVEFRAKAPEFKNLNARGQIGSDGTFTVSTYGESDGAVAGEHDVVVIPKAIINTNSDQPTPPDPIDNKFRDYSTSGLQATVKPESTNKVELKVVPPGM